MVAFSAGTLFGTAFLHLLPEVMGEFSNTLALLILSGILIFLILEKLIHWRHCHLPSNAEHHHPVATMNLLGDALHNFLDGIIIMAAFNISISVGVATSVAVLLHEIPQEIGNFGVLIYAGYSKLRALFYNFCVSMTAVLGVVAAYCLTTRIEGLNMPLTAVAIGGFIYIAGSDLIPELHKENSTAASLKQISFFILGIGIMIVSLWLE